MQNNKLILLIGLTLLLPGCATNITDVTNENALTMQQIYDGDVAESEEDNNDINEGEEKNKDESVKIKRKINDGDVDLTPYTRTAANEINVLFKRLPNPILVGYVYPHLNSDNTPIPGYSIPFRMSNNDYFEMPGE